MKRPTSKHGPTPPPPQDRVAETTRTRVVPEGTTPCVWMEAGVLTWWLCDRSLECADCALDAALRHADTRAVDAGRTGLRRDDAPPPSTRTALGTEVTSAARSPFSDLVDRPLPGLDPQSLYSNSHVWLRIGRNGLVRMGLDPLAAWVLGRLRCIVLAPAAMRIRRGDPCAWLDQSGGTLTVRSPLSGQVVEANEDLLGRGEVDLRDPLRSEWLLLLRPWRLRSEARRLVRAPQFEAVVESHASAWRRLLHDALGAESPLGPTLADGGSAVAGVEDLIGAERHHRAAEALLRGFAPRG